VTGTSQRQRDPRPRTGRAVWRIGALIIVALVALVVILVTAHRSSRHTDSAPGKLLWAPPIMKSPTTIGLKSGSDPEHLRLSPKQDYVLKMPPDGVHGTIEIDGGHNVTLIGGSVIVPSTANQTDNGADNTDTAIYIRHSTGTVHIEGVLIKADHDVQYDGIDINAPKATVQIENVRIEKVYGSASTEHADAIQPWGGVRLLQIDNLTADGDYQGLTINPNLSSVTANIHNVDLTADPRPTAIASHTVGGGIMLWLTSTSSCSAAARAHLENVYVNNQSGRVATARTVWPSSNSPLPCAGVLHGDQMSWPKLPSVTGVVNFGTPPDGSFVPDGLAGNSYISPGYVGHPSTVKP
jgi:hypothetical protein